MTYTLVTAGILVGILLGIVIGGHMALRRTPPTPQGKSAVEHWHGCYESIIRSVEGEKEQLS